MAAKTPFSAATTKFKIASLDDTTLSVSAQYNPKEVSVSQAVAWTQDPKKAPGDQALQFQSGARNPRKYTVDLVFDGVEPKGKDGPQGYLRGQETTVIDQLKNLQKLVDLVPASDKRKLNDVRPHFCVALWGKDGVPSMPCVIENLTVKYEMFDELGKVIRATATIQIMEAWRVDKDKSAFLVTSEKYADQLRK